MSQLLQVREMRGSNKGSGEVNKEIGVPGSPWFLLLAVSGVGHDDHTSG